MRHNEGRVTRPQAVLKAERSGETANGKVYGALVDLYLARAWLGFVADAVQQAEETAHQVIGNLPIKW